MSIRRTPPEKDLRATSDDAIVEFLDVLDDIQKRLTAIETTFENERSMLQSQRHGYDHVLKDIEVVNAKIAEIMETMARFEAQTRKRPAAR